MSYEGQSSDQTMEEILGRTRQIMLPKRFEQLMKLTDEQVQSKLVDNAILKNKGALIFFINGNVLSSINMIGMTRIQEADARLIPLWLTENESMVKRKAMGALYKHFQRTQCATGAGEPLTAEDYSLEYAVASVTPVGSMFNPCRKNEVPIGCCHLDGLVEPVLIRRDDGTGKPDYAHVIYAYIYLFPHGQRLGPVLKRLKAERSNPPNPDAKRQKTGSNPNKRPNSDALLKTDKKVDVLSQKMDVMMERIPVGPSLPKSAGPRAWPDKTDDEFAEFSNE